MPVMPSLLLPSFVRGVISRIKLPTLTVARHFGFEMDGRNVQQVPGRSYTYDIYDNVRTVANGRLPGAPAGTVSLNPVGNNTVALARFAEKIELAYSQINMIRTIGKDAGTRDIMGLQYIERQAGTLRRRSDNVREFITGALFQGGKYSFYQNGDDLVPSYDTTSGVYFGVDLKIASQCLMLGSSYANAVSNNNSGNGLVIVSGSTTNLIPNAWSDTVNANIPLQLANISSAFQDAVGAPLLECWMGSDVWNNVLQNNFIKNLAGTANVPFATYDVTNDVGPDGTDSRFIRATLKGVPNIYFYIWDGSLSLASGSATTFSNVKVLPRNTVTFMTQPEGWVKCIEGSEPVADNDIAEPVERYGFYAWAMRKADPARIYYHTLQNVALELNIPNALATARVQ